MSLLYAGSSLLGTLLCFILGTAAVVHSGQRQARWEFGMTAYGIGVWTSFPFLTSLITSESQRLFIARLLYVDASFVPNMFLYFTLALVGLQQDRNERRFFRWSLVISFMSACLVWSTLFIRGVHHGAAFRAPVPGPLFPAFVLYFGVVCGYSFYKVFNLYRITTGATRNQLRYVLAGFGTAYLGGFLHFVGALFGIEPLPHDIFIIGCILILAYAILKHRLLDITLAARDSLIYTTAAGILAVPFVGLILAIRSPWLLAFVFLAWFLVVLRWYGRLQERLRPWIDRWVFGGQYDYLKDLKALGGSLYHIYSQNQLLETLVQGLTETMQTETCSVLMWDAAGGEFRVGAQVGLDALTQRTSEGPPLRLQKQNPLVRAMELHQGPLLKEELVRQRTASQYYAIAREMELLQAELIMPLYVEGQMRGFLTLGPKRSGAMYNQKDLALLGKLAEDAERILSYTVIIYEQTLATTKIAHDARQPLGGVFSWIYALRDDLLGPTTPEQREVFRKLEHNIGFVNEFFNDLLEMNRLIVERIRGEVAFAPFDLGALLRQVTDSLRAKAAPGVELLLDVPARLPPAFGHERGCQRAFSNLVINALKFTKQGMVRVRAQPKRDGVEVRVQDTGPGIPEAELPKLFEPFAQTPEGKDVAEGMGLGLTIVKEVVALHEGQLRVESRVGEGTTFIVGLPALDSPFAHAHASPLSRNGQLKREAA